MTCIPVIPNLLTRARQRAELDVFALAGRLSSGTTKPREGSHE